MIDMLRRDNSSIAETIDEQVTACGYSLRESAALGNEQAIRGELADVWEECREPDWDGYGALPVSTDSFADAWRLVSSLPFGTKPPSIGALPDGNITLEWYHSRLRSLTVIVGDDGDLHYAAMFGPERVCGTVPFFGEFPQGLRFLIAKVYSC